MKTTRTFILLAAAALTQPAFAGEQAVFMGLGDLPGGIFQSATLGVSPDGTRVFGYSNTVNGGQLFEWTLEDGMKPTLVLPLNHEWHSAIHVRGTSADGAVVVGSGNHIGFGGEACYLSIAGGNLHGLGDLAGGTYFSEAAATNQNGSVIVGRSDSTDGVQAFRWTLTNGMVGLGDLPGGSFESKAIAVNADGSVVTGTSLSAQGEEPFIWSDATGMTGLDGHPTNFIWSRAANISADGTTVVGTITRWFDPANPDPFHTYPTGFFWTQASGMQYISSKSMNGTIYNFTPTNSTPDGSVIAGNVYQKDIFLWTERSGIRLLSDYPGIDLTGWKIDETLGVSDDGRVVVGSGRNPDGKMEAFIAIFPPECLSDYNSNSVRDVQDLFGYINAWLAKDAAADVNNDTAVDVADLFAFINAWLAGC